MTDGIPDLFTAGAILRLKRVNLAIDANRPQPQAFVSHAHMDHMAGHQFAVCSEPTAKLYQLRFGPRRVRTMTFGTALTWGPLELTAYPAGHCLGSSMLHVRDRDSGRTLLYSGDFRLGPSATAEPAHVPQADVFIMESTFGHPQYSWRPREEIAAELVQMVRTALQRQQTPVVYAYAVGKAQEVTRILTSAGIPVLQHPRVYQVSQVYRECGVQLGEFRLYERPVAGCAVVTPPRFHEPTRLPGLQRVCDIGVTGWADGPAAVRRWGTVNLIELSDHADFGELIEAARRVEATQIYCTHGPPEFVDHLRSAGFPAELLPQS